MMQMPGKTASHHFPSMRDSRSWAIIKPQDGSGGGTPTFRKLMEPSMMIEIPAYRLNTIMQRDDGGRADDIQAALDGPRQHDHKWDTSGCRWHASPTSKAEYGDRHRHTGYR